LNSLRKNDSIKILNFDKGNGVVILNSVDYFNKLDSIVKDSSKFKVISVDPDDPSKHPIVKNENSVLYNLRTYLKPFIDDSTFSLLCPSGSLPGKLYGLAKVHKNNHPLRPVISMLQTSQYKLAKFLDSLIKPVIPNLFMLNSTKDFLDKIRSFKFSDADYIVSFDVESLFTNVPLNETIDIICSYVYDEHNTNIPNFPVKNFKKLLTVSVGGLFMYNSLFYQQIDGVSMGNPLGPTFANCFLAHLEKDFFKHTFSPKFYSRYIDDIFCVFSSSNDCDKFLDFINSVHPNLKFTVEKGNRGLAFLDTFVEIDSKNICHTKVYRKPTFTGLILNRFSSCPSSYKIGLLLGFLHRAFIICSSWQLFHSEIINIVKIFTNNGYSSDFVFNIINKFVSSKFITRFLVKKMLYLTVSLSLFLVIVPLF
jgi:hypothetical protein